MGIIKSSLGETPALHTIHKGLLTARCRKAFNWCSY